MALYAERKQALFTVDLTLSKTLESELRQLLQDLGICGNV
jgi:hypothetical protein